jgi:protoheme IX farnesyltransferase
MVLATAAAGYWMGSAGTLDHKRFLATIAGVALLAAGVFTLNQYIERDLDVLMRRTLRRPLPSGRVKPAGAMWFGWALSATAITCLAVYVNALSAAVGVLTLASYLFLYTPLKTRTPHCTLVGAFPGAAPPLLGWAAARGELGFGAWSLFAILFLWQFPHFHAIALLYRDDYAKADIRLWPVVEPKGTTVRWQILVCAILLLPISLTPAALKLAGPVYAWGAAALGAGFLYLSARAACGKAASEAQLLLLGSVVYLPGLLLLMALNR